MKRELLKKLSSYSALVTSIVLMAKNNSSAQIIYVDPPDIVLHQGEASLDLDNNGTVDFVFSVHGTPSQEYPANQIAVLAPSSLSNEFEMLNGTTCGIGLYSYRPKVMNAGEVVKHGKLWHYLSNSIGGQFCFSGYPFCDLWSGKQNKFIGVAFTDSPNHTHHHYGWIRLSVNSGCNAITIKDWAYNTVINKGIITGQTMRSASDEFNSDVNASGIFSYGNTIHIQNNLSNSELTVTIYNSIGECVKKVKTSETAASFEITNGSAGIYFVRVSSAEGTVEKEVMLQ